MNHLTAGRIPAPERASGSSASRSSMYPDSASRPPLTGDPWSTFNQGWPTVEGYDDDGALRNSWKAFAIASDQQIRNLVQVYFEIVYPMYEFDSCAASLPHQLTITNLVPDFLCFTSHLS